MSTEIEWGDPPPTMRGSHRGAQRFVAALRERPGEWALYPTRMRGAGSGSEYKKQYPGTEWTIRSQPDGTYLMWARWVGNGDQS